MAKREESKGAFEGARKVAALLSMVDLKTADALLAQFDSEVAAEIAREAKNIKDAPREEFESVLSEFLRSTRNNSEIPRANEPRASNVLTPESAARALRNERSFVGAVIVASMTARDRLRTLELLPQEQAEEIRRIASMQLEPTSVSKELELEFTRRAIRNER